jgi:hypothetical protein
MISDGSEEILFGQELVALTRAAVNFHHEISGNPTPPDEKFIRDWIVVQLFRSQRRQAMMEITRDEFWCEVAKRKPASEERRLFPPGRIDVIIFGQDHADEAFAIVELKLDARFTKLNNITNDIERISRLLSVCKQDMVGYQLVCIVVGGQEGLHHLADGLSEGIRHLGARCGKIEHDEFAMKDKEKTVGWCGIYVVPVRRA